MHQSPANHCLAILAFALAGAQAAAGDDIVIGQSRMADDDSAERADRSAHRPLPLVVAGPRVVDPNERLVVQEVAVALDRRQLSGNR